MTLPTLNNTVLHGYQFPENDFRIIKAAESKRLRYLSDVELLNLMIRSINKSILALNHKPMSNEDLSATASLMISSVKSNYLNVRVNEFEYAVELGAMGEFGEDVVFVSAKNVIRWLKKYAERKINVFKELTTQKEKEALTTSLNASNEKQEIYWKEFAKNLNEEFINYMVSGELSNVAWIYCKNLEEIGYKDFLEMDNVKKWEIYEEEKANAIRNKREELKKTHLIFSEKMIKSESLESEIIKQCRLRSLKIWFDSIDRIDIEKIENLIKI